MTTQDTRVWRVWPDSKPPQVWAVNPDGDDELIAQVGTVAAAEQIVAEHALVTTPYVDDEHRGGSWVQLIGELQSELLGLRTQINNGSAAWPTTPPPPSSPASPTVGSPSPGPGNITGRPARAPSALRTGAGVVPQVDRHHAAIRMTGVDNSLRQRIQFSTSARQEPTARSPT